MGRSCKSLSGQPGKRGGGFKWTDVEPTKEDLDRLRRALVGALQALPGDSEPVAPLLLDCPTCGHSSEPAQFTLGALGRVALLADSDGQRRQMDADEINHVGRALLGAGSVVAKYASGDLMTTNEHELAALDDEELRQIGEAWAEDAMIEALRRRHLVDEEWKRRETENE